MNFLNRFPGTDNLLRDPITIMAGVGGISALAGAVGGVIEGATDDPDQVTNQSNKTDTTNTANTTSQLQVQKASWDEQRARDQMLDQLIQQGRLADQAGGAQSIDPAYANQQAAQQGISSIIDGSAFNITPQEQAQIDAIRQSSVDAGSTNIQQFLNQNLTKLNTDAGVRGLRGQAAQELQGQAVNTAAQQLANIQAQANVTAAQQAQGAAQQRIAAQSPFLQQGATAGVDLATRAAALRAQASNPAVAQLYQNERLATGQQTSNTTQNQTSNTTGNTTVPGREGSFGQALLGGISGLGQGAAAGGQLAGAINGLGSMGGGLTTGTPTTGVANNMRYPTTSGYMNA